MSVEIRCGDCRDVLARMPDESVHCVVTSPPYCGLRDYKVPPVVWADGWRGALGLEPTFQMYVEHMVEVFREVRRVLRKDGTLWLNLGDSYAGGGGFCATAPSSPDTKSGKYGLLGGLKPGGLHPQGVIKAKDLCGVPWRVAFALQADGWWLRSDIIWAKPNPMPESVTDRPTKSHEYLFLLSKNEQYFYDAEAIKEQSTYPDDNRKARQRLDDYQERAVDRIAAINPLNATTYPKRNKRSVWEIATSPFPEAHFATFPPALVEPCIKAGCPERGVVLDPFGGAGTVGLVADRLQRNAVLIELNAGYAAMAEVRIRSEAPLFIEAGVGRGELVP